MRWLVGIDSRNFSAGAASVARWCAARSSVDSFVGVHVLEQAATALAAELQPPLEAGTLHRLAEATLDPLRAESTFEEIAVVEDLSVEDGLVQAANERGADAFLLGRRKPSDRGALFRLGRVARRMLRRLPLPVMIVPPDLRGEMMTGGPVILGTDLSRTSAGALAFASVLARTLDLELAVAHVVRMPDSLQPMIPAESWDDRVAQHSASRALDLERWAADHGIEGVRQIVGNGTPTLRLAEMATEVRASIIVVGSRGLSTLDRLFESSVGSDLAASAPIPVAVVPSTGTAPRASDRPSQPMSP